MDIAFTIAVWILLVSLTGYGLRLTQREHAQAGQVAVAAPAAPPLPSHPVSSYAPAPRELVGAGS